MYPAAKQASAASSEIRGKQNVRQRGIRRESKRVPDKWEQHSASAGRSTRCPPSSVFPWQMLPPLVSFRARDETHRPSLLPCSASGRMNASFFLPISLLLSLPKSPRPTLAKHPSVASASSFFSSLSFLSSLFSLSTLARSPAASDTSTVSRSGSRKSPVARLRPPPVAVCRSRCNPAVACLLSCVPAFETRRRLDPSRRNHPQGRHITLRSLKHIQSINQPIQP